MGLSRKSGCVEWRGGWAVHRDVIRGILKTGKDRSGPFLCFSRISHAQSAKSNSPTKTPLLAYCGSAQCGTRGVSVGLDRRGAAPLVAPPASSARIVEINTATAVCAGSASINRCSVAHRIRQQNTALCCNTWNCCDDLNKYFIKGKWPFNQLTLRF